MNDKLIEAINEIANLSNDDKQNIKGKFYTTVDKRLQTFRKHFGSNARITTKIIHHDLERVVVQATVSVYMDGSWREIGNDFAEEFRGQGMVNKTSALENCCTSAIGRALASCGLGGGEYASGFEVDNAINNKEPAPDLRRSYVINDIKGHPVSSRPTPEKYLDGLRGVLADPSSEECKGIYATNKETIKNIYSSLPSDSSLLDSFEKLINLYKAEV